MMDNSDNSILSIQSIPLDADPKELVDLFGIAGPITQAHIARHPQTLESLGYGFVKYANPGDAKRALNLNGKTMRDSTLVVTMHSTSASEPASVARAQPTPLMPTPTQSQQLPLLNDPTPVPNNDIPPNLMASMSNPPSFNRPPIVTNGPAFLPAKVFLENIPVTMKELEIRSQFGRFGQILEVKILLDGAGLSKGIGYIKYESLEAAAKAATEMNGIRVENGFKPLSCKLSGSKEHSDDGKPRKSRFSDAEANANEARLARFGGGGNSPMIGIQRTVSLTGPGATGNRFEPYAKPQQNSFTGQQQALPQANQYNQGQSLASEFSQYQTQQANPWQQQTQEYNQAPTQGYGQVQNSGYQQVAQGYQQGQGYNQTQGYNQAQSQGYNQGHTQGQGHTHGQQQGYSAPAITNNDPNGAKSIYVGNLPDTSCKNCLLYNLFAPYGAVESVKGLEGKDSEHKTWFGFVNYVDTGAAERAVSMLDKSSLDGSNLKVQIKNDRPRAPRAPRSGGIKAYNGKWSEKATEKN